MAARWLRGGREVAARWLMKRYPERGRLGWPQGGGGIDDVGGGRGCLIRYSSFLRAHLASLFSSSHALFLALQASRCVSLYLMFETLAAYLRCSSVKIFLGRPRGLAYTMGVGGTSGKSDC